LSCLASALVTPITYGYGAGAWENLSHKHRYELDSNSKPGGLQHSALTIVPLEQPREREKKF